MKSKSERDMSEDVEDETLRADETSPKIYPVGNYWMY
jgi:hypothetical protein